MTMWHLKLTAQTDLRRNGHSEDEERSGYPQEDLKMGLSKRHHYNVRASEY